MPGDDDRLSALLGGTVPPGIAALPDSGRAELARLVEQARTRQRHELAESLEATLRHVPFPVRGLAKRMLTG